MSEAPSGAPSGAPPSDESTHPTSSARTDFGKYHAFAVLGSGGMADVYLAIARGPKGFNKLVVVKSLKPEFTRDASFVDMFLDEARLAARLNHPNVVQTYEVGDSEDAHFIAMEFLEGQSLNRVLDALTRRRESLQPPVIARLVSDALAGLHYAHELRDYDGQPLNIIHRDVSPHNLFVTYDGQVKVVDFGIAKAASSSTQTEVGVVKGKVAYMSPEQALGDRVDRRSDIFAMGIVLWEALTLTPFSQGMPIAARMARLLTEGVPAVSSVVHGLDPALDEIVAKALHKDPSGRFQTAAEMRDALEAWISQAGTVVRQEDLGRRLDDMFREVRTEMRRKVKAQMAAAVTSGAVDDLPPPSLADSRRSGVIAAPPGGPGTSAAVTVAPKSRRPPERGVPRRAVFAGLAAVVAVAGALGLWRWSAPRADEASSRASARAAAPLESATAPSSEIEEGRTDSFGPLPVVASVESNPLSEEKITLGRMLFYEQRLSRNHDVSCNSCHLLDKYGVDGKKVSTGHAQQQGTRNSPSVYNSAGFFALMWDGKFATIEEQAKGPLQKNVEMNSTPKRVEETLLSMPEYVQAFAKAFPAEKAPVTYENTTRAIGAFERKLFTPARWERFLAGEKDALTPAEKAGFNTFVDTGCPSCHFGPYVGATMFQKLGLVKAWPTTRDRGRFELTQKNEDYMVFRVPSLRNVAMTGPYLHDGSITNLPEVVKMMARHQLGKELTEAQAASIVSFLGCLTGDLPLAYIKKPELPPSGPKTPHPEL